jgi:hypothetical protein
MPSTPSPPLAPTQPAVWDVNPSSEAPLDNFERALIVSCSSNLSKRQLTSPLFPQNALSAVRELGAAVREVPPEQRVEALLSNKVFMDMVRDALVGEERCVRTVEVLPPSIMTNFHHLSQSAQKA